MVSDFILASASPRREILLKRAGFRFQVHPAEILERQFTGETAQAFVDRLAREKAEKVAPTYPKKWVLAADTIVVADPGTELETVLGKPSGPEEAANMLRRLSATSHRVVTAVALARSAGSDLETRSFASTATVTFRALLPEEIESYAASGEPLDKAGAYAIQGGAEGFVESFEGSWSAIVGLPMEETIKALREVGITPA